MLIVNADDLGRSRKETDLIVSCYEKRRITSSTVMVFMEDSARAAELTKDSGLDIGLHLNLTQPFNGEVRSDRLREYHRRVICFLSLNKYTVCIYNPALRAQFRYVFEAQLEEFERLYGRRPSHIDGHQHRHLCLNMLLDGVIPAEEKVRRSFSFWPGEKSKFNRAYRWTVDKLLTRRYKLADFFFSLEQCLEFNRMQRVVELSGKSVVELMTHPLNPKEYAYLMGDAHQTVLSGLQTGTYALL